MLQAFVNDCLLSLIYTTGYVLTTTLVFNVMAGYQYYYSRPDRIWRGEHTGFTYPLREVLQHIRFIERTKIQQLKARAYFDVGSILNMLHKGLTLLSITAINAALVPNVLIHRLIPRQYVADKLQSWPVFFSKRYLPYGALLGIHDGKVISTIYKHA